MASIQWSEIDLTAIRSLKKKAIDSMWFTAASELRSMEKIIEKKLKAEWTDNIIKNAFSGEETGK